MRSSHPGVPHRRPRFSTKRTGPVGIVSLNRPEVLNAYNVAMRDALFEALQAVRDDPDVGALVLRGNGPAFSTGGDVTRVRHGALSGGGARHPLAP